MSRTLRIAAAAITVLVLAIGFGLYYKYLGGPAVPAGLDDYLVEIPSNSTFDEVIAILKGKGILEDEVAFRLMAERMNYIRNPMRGGRYEVKAGWSLLHLIRHLRGGKQAPVNVILTNERLTEEVAGKVASFIEPDSADILALFQDEDYLESIEYSHETLMSLFIPNTYEFFWNTRPEDFMKRMIREHDGFWEKDNRKQKATALGMSPAEVYTLASIVEKETLADSEKPTIAGVYLNRLELGMRLQADPTSVFARRDFWNGKSDGLSYQVRFTLQYLSLCRPATWPYLHGFNHQY